MRYPSRSWTSLPGIAIRWAEAAVLFFLYVAGRLALGLDASLDWKQWGSLVLLSTLIHGLVWNYGRPRGSEGDATSS